MTDRPVSENAVRQLKVRNCAGIVGLAIGRALALTGREVIVLEAADAIGTSTSSRNSEVVHSGAARAQHTRNRHAMMLVKPAAAQLQPWVRQLAHRSHSRALGKGHHKQGNASQQPCRSHLRSGFADAGIYYPPGSLKAKLSVDGNLKRLEPYCQDHGVPFRRLGKLLVATDESQIGKLRELQGNGRKNGVRAVCLPAVFWYCRAARAPGRDKSATVSEARADARLRSAPKLLCRCKRGLKCFSWRSVHVIPCKRRVRHPQD